MGGVLQFDMWYAAGGDRLRGCTVRRSAYPRKMWTMTIEAALTVGWSPNLYVQEHDCALFPSHHPYLCLRFTKQQW